MRAESELIDPENVDRPAGFLTKTERQYLLGEWDPNGEGGGSFTPTQESNKRSDIKIRTRHALADIALMKKYGDFETISGVVERDTDIQTFFPNTLEHARDGLTAFIIYLAYGPQEADEMIRALEKTNWDGAIEDVVSASNRSHEVAEEYSESASFLADQAKQYADANGLTKEEMIDAIYLNWPE